MGTRIVSPSSREVLRMLGMGIKSNRLRRGWSLDELAHRAGVSRPTITKIEAGDPGVMIGTVFEAAHLVQFPLFHPDADVRGLFAASLAGQLALLPATARATHTDVDDDF